MNYAQHLDQVVRIHHWKFRVNPRHAVWAETESLVLKTAETPAEISQALRLRYQVFFRELAPRWYRLPLGFDIDSFDFSCDHIIICEKATGRIVGTYRLQVPEATAKCYSAMEFDLSPLDRFPGTKLELGRACVAPEHRSGPVIQLLWRGISEYARRSGARYLLGCSSFKTTSHREVHALDFYLQESGAARRDLRIQAHPGFAPRRDRGEAVFTPVEAREIARPLLPKLFLSYLRAGAKVCSGPAIDREMDCTDFLTLLDLEQLEAVHARKFLGRA